jgi:hypothetical protein
MRSHHRLLSPVVAPFFIRLFTFLLTNRASMVSKILTFSRVGAFMPQEEAKAIQKHLPQPTNPNSVDSLAKEIIRHLDEESNRHFAEITAEEKQGAA